MILYHGSREIVEQPLYGKGSENNDYGQGFYCTESLELAKEWACPEIKDGFANPRVQHCRSVRHLVVDR